MERKTAPLAALALMLLFGTACSTDIEINAPYKNITVMYALLSKDDNDSGAHYVRINKAFLGDGDNYLYAQQPDSITYRDQDLDAWVERVEADGSVSASYPLEPVILENKEPGVFSYPSHKLYRFRTELDSSVRYRIVADAKGERITSITELPYMANVSAGLLNPTSAPFRAWSVSYVSYNIPFTSTRNGKRYEVNYHFRWKEILANGDTLPEKSFKRFVGSAIADNLNGGHSMAVSVGGRDFFQAVVDEVKPDPAVVRRVVSGFDISIVAGGGDLNTFLLLSDPVSGVVEDRPLYSNVEGGYGLVSARRTRWVRNKRIEGPTRERLMSGPETGHLLFCWPNGDYACP